MNRDDKISIPRIDNMLLFLDVSIVIAIRWCGDLGDRLGERVRVGGECLKLFGDDRPFDLVGDLYSYEVDIFSTAILCVLLFGDDFISIGTVISL